VKLLQLLEIPSKIRSKHLSTVKLLLLSLAAQEKFTTRRRKVESAKELSKEVCQDLDNLELARGNLY
jgi:hypothetical protein